MMAVRGWSEGMAASAFARSVRLVTSQAVTMAWAPAVSRSEIRSLAPGAPGPRRESRRRWRAWPVAARWRAMMAPRVPVPPVIRTVPSGSSGGSAGGVVAGVVRVRRGACRAWSRMAARGSPAARAAASAAAGLGLASSVVRGLRSRWVMRAGCSFWAVRMRPEVAAAGRSVAGPGPVAPAVIQASGTAPRRGAARYACSRARVSPTAVMAAAGGVVSSGAAGGPARIRAGARASVSRAVSSWLREG